MKIENVQIFHNCTYCVKQKSNIESVTTIEEGREQQVTSYLRPWTQLIRLHGLGVAPVQPYSCPEMYLYWQDYSRPCSLIS